MSEHSSSLMPYVLVLVGLLALTALTVLVALVDFGHPWSDAVALAIALSKASLVVLFFMHVKGTPAERHLMQTLAREALRNRQERQHAAKRLKTLAKRLPSVVALQPAWGETTAAVLVSEVGEPRCFETPSSYVKAFGLNLKVRSSGRYNGQLRITKRGSSVARRWLYMLALRKVQRDTVIRAWYQKKIARDGGIKMKALIAIMRKLAAAMWHVARGAEFDSTKLFDVRRLAVSEAGH